MRDHLKDEDDFKDYIEQHHSAIVEFEDLAEQLINERGRNLGFSTLQGLPPKLLMTAPSATPGNATKKPEESENGFLKAAKDFADTMLLDDLETITDKDSSLLQKGIAIFGMTPMGKGEKAGKLGFKLVKEQYGAQRKTPLHRH